MKRNILIPILFLFHFSLAQVDREDPPVPSAAQIRINDQRISGKVTDSRSGKGIEAASVQVFAFFDGKDSLVAGMLTRANGDFSFNALPQADSLKILVTGIGYNDLNRIITGLNNRNSEVYELGNLSLVPGNNVLSDVVVSTQRPALLMGIDRKIFNVERSLVSTGGTALDVMRNIPSVSVDVEGNVTLRNSQPQIFVDGRPTILTPDQIPADQVERIELITNPSAKFDASSSAGIINIVMKRNRKVGLNGIVAIGAGQPDIFNGNLTLNARQGRFNLFMSGGYNQSGGKAKGETFRQNFENNKTQNYFNQLTWNTRKHQFTSLRFGLDFFASNRTTLSASQNFVFGKSKNIEEQEQEYLDSTRQLIQYGTRSGNNTREFNRKNTQFNISHRFPEQGKELTLNMNYNFGDRNDAANILNSFFLPNGNPAADPARVRNAGLNDNDQYILQLDYADPVSEEGKLEAGARWYTSSQNSSFLSYSVENGTETLLPFSNNNKYKETVHAAYFTWSDKKESFSYQLGLRAEVSDFEGEIPDSSKSFGYNYPENFDHFFDAFFPSIFLTKEVGENTELQVNYSRRIRRPNFWHLNPFIDINDPVNLRQGNPYLQPEFINSFEFNLSRDYSKGNFLGVIYYHNNMRDITRYSDTISAGLYQQLNNAAIDPNAILNTFINAKSTNRLGAELTLQHEFSPRFDITPSVDLQYRKVNADVNNIQLSNSGFNWEGDLTINYKWDENQKGVLKNLGLQISGEYESEETTAQGRNVPQYGFDFALRKEFLKEKKASFTFNINDVLNSYEYGNIYDTKNFYQESYRRRNVRTFRISFTYKFGKDDFSILRRQEERDRSSDDESL